MISGSVPSTYVAVKVKYFGNARYVEKYLSKVIMKHSENVYDKKSNIYKITTDDLDINDTNENVSKPIESKPVIETEEISSGGVNPFGAIAGIAGALGAGGLAAAAYVNSKKDNSEEKEEETKEEVVEEVKEEVKEPNSFFNNIVKE